MRAATDNVKRREFACVLRVAVTSAALSLAASSGAAFELTACGTVIEEKQTGVLTGDLECPGTGPRPVFIERGGTLDLNGFTLTHNVVDTVPFSWESPIACSGWCNVVSSALAPGRVAGVGNPQTIGIQMEASRVRVENVEITGFHSGIRWRPNSVGGQQFIRAQMRDVVLRDMTYGVFYLRRLNGENVTIAGAMDTGLFVNGPIKLQGFTCVEGSGRCASTTGNLRVDDAVISGASEIALYGTRVTLVRSDVRGSAIDIASHRKPTVIESLCDTSKNLSEPGTSWGVCALD